MKVAVVGVTGLVGKVMREVMEESGLALSQFIPVASQRSIGKLVKFAGKEYPVVGMEEAISMIPDIALFSAGGGTSKEWAPKFAEVGTTVIDNSSAWRMDPDKKLVVPEINASQLTDTDKIIANPNCSTIQMVMALNPLHQINPIKRLVISTYQSYTGTGAVAVNQYNEERAGNTVPSEEAAYAHRIFANCIPHCGDVEDGAYTTEEIKLVKETRKIIGDDSIAITATAVRVPVDGGHSESVNIEFTHPYDLEEMKQALSNTPGVVVQDDITNNIYPMPYYSKDKNEVFVGRIRRDHSIENGLHLWIVSDNLRKGAATNAVQIAQYLISNRLV